MNDTSPETQAAFLSLLAERTDVERLRMTCAMFDDAKALVRAEILSRRPDISESDLRVEMFDRLYFGDFDAATRDRIVAGLRSGA